MNVCIIGWYGTETIGDRAILAGILTFLAETYDDLSIQLGSLFPFFSERTVREDSDLWARLVGSELSVTLFDSTCPKELQRAIRSSNLLMLGGGPLMDLREMHMAEFAFRYARRNKVRTAVFGCGIGPLRQRTFERAAAGILANADAVVLRDRFSVEALQKLRLHHEVRPVSAVDPAAYCAMRYSEITGSTEPRKQVAINLRRMPGRYGAPSEDSKFEAFAQDFLEKVLSEYGDLQIVLVPNHYFFFGGDDRFFMNTLKFRINNSNLRVQNQPLSLSATMDTFMSSSCCVGMRFHSVVLMSLLNGRCRILNYTDPSKGKIAGFLNDFDPDGYFGPGRQLSLDGDLRDLSVADNLLEEEKYSVPTSLLNSAFETYRNVLRKLL